jgi:cytochrome c biogenesis protein CcdA
MKQLFSLSSYNYIYLYALSFTLTMAIIGAVIYLLSKAREFYQKVLVIIAGLVIIPLLLAATIYFVERT